jgi:hypothetical protein
LKSRRKRREISTKISTGELWHSRIGRKQWCHSRLSPHFNTDVSKLGRGGEWDLQRLSGKFDPRFVDSATILIGMYAASAGITRSQILSIENDVAITSSYAKGTPMDSTFTHLPARNVTNTDIGMRLVQSGAYVP